MNLKLNYYYIYIAIFTSFFFLWGIDLKVIFLKLDPTEHHGSYFRLNFLIIFLIIPIFFNCIKEKDSFFKKIFNYQKYIIFFTLFVVAHYFLVKVYYQEVIDKSEILNLSYWLVLTVIYCHYREFISTNFKKILILYLTIFVLYSIFDSARPFNIGQCNNNIFIISLIQDYLKISLTNSIYLENSHLAMMTIAVFFSSLYVLVKEKKIDILFLLMFSIEVIIVLNNLSTTYFVGYFFSQVVLLLFFFKKIDNKFWIVGILFLLINSYLFLSDKNCTTKITDFNLQDVSQKELKQNYGNSTTSVYQRSIIVAQETLTNHTLGWGIDGMDNATFNLFSNYKDCSFFDCDENDKDFDMTLAKLNVKDGLSNLLKLFTEFGIFAFIIYFYFLKYILNIKNINSYNIFIIVLFITMSIRGAGYFNGAFIFCLLEFLYFNKFIQRLKF